MARYDYHLENGSPEHTDDVAFGEDEGDSEDDDEGGDWDAREGVQKEGDSEDEGCLKGPRPLQPSLTDSSSHGHGGRGLNKKHEFHKEYKELKMTTLSLERERLAGHKAKRDREEQALEEHRRTERRMKEEEMEYR
ncbi:hypothetical protein AYX13_04922 [Cryptococcus neoformans]|nr:hypothetical protein AYX13_04922 [Cryptococcus neoformans var. grubii]